MLNRKQQHSEYDWMNIEYGNTRVGKIRGQINAKVITIYSINIFPEFEGRGYAKKTIEMFKTTFDAIIADRVRPKAVGFWDKMGFRKIQGDNYVYLKKGAYLHHFPLTGIKK